MEQEPGLTIIIITTSSAFIAETSPRGDTGHSLHRWVVLSYMLKQIVSFLFPAGVVCTVYRAPGPFMIILTELEHLRMFLAPAAYSLHQPRTEDV